VPPNDDQTARAERFRSLHHDGPILQLVNVWDRTSARVAAASGAAALGTTSFGVAAANGYADGEHMPFDRVLDATAAIVAAVDVPVSLDLEAGHGPTPDAVRDAVAAAIGCGAVGVNIEDSVPGVVGSLVAVEVQAARLGAARAAAEDAGVPIFVNARCDVYFGADLPADRRVDEVLERADRYAAAGADGLFLPGLVDLDTIGAVVERTDLPLNVMVVPGIPSLAELDAAGVRRVSQGGASFLAVAGVLSSLATGYLAGDLVPPIDQFAAGLAMVPELVR
jgi:2-methylisocitrate lyase-like PEP mutase family enzyme